MFSAGTIQGGGTPNTNETCQLINRTGATLVKGDIVALNLDFAATAGQAMVSLDPGAFETDSSSGYIYGAAIAVTTENATREVLVYLGPGDLADNAVGLFGKDGIFECEMNGAGAGEFLYATNGQTYLTPVTLTEILALSNTYIGVVGYALEATTGAQVKKARFCGDAWKHLVGDAT